jgi:hypothetical protein
MLQLLLVLALHVTSPPARVGPPESAPKCAKGLVAERVESGSTVELGCVGASDGRPREGRWRVFAQGRLDHEGTFRGGRKDGTWQGFTAEGARAWTAQWKEGQEHGVWRTWFSNGKLETEVRYVRGKLDGPWKSFHPNGRVRDVHRYRAGLLDGKVTSRDELGRLRIDGAYRAGKRHGWWKELCPDGKPYLQARYEDGVPVEGDVSGVPPDRIACETWR